MMVCPDKKPKGKFHIYFNGKDMGEVEPYIETDEDVNVWNLQDARRLLTPRFTVPIKYQPLFVMRSKGWLMKGIVESPFVQAWANLILIRGRYAVRPFMM